jgi:hypothetical protein
MNSSLAHDLTSVMRSPLLFWKRYSRIQLKRYQQEAALAILGALHHIHSAMHPLFGCAALGPRRAPTSMYNILMRSHHWSVPSLVLGIWLVGIVFPAIWLRQFSNTYRQIFDSLFGPEWVHIVMHLAIYAVLGILLMVVFRLPSTRKGLLQLALFILIAGVLQETFQAASQDVSLFQASILSAAAFDWVIDLSGGLLCFIILALARTLKSKANPNHYGPSPTNN